MSTKMASLLGLLFLLCGLSPMMKLVLADDPGTFCPFGCYKGNCVVGNICQCETGWSNLLASTEYPCVLPNCTLDVSCSASPAPALPPPLPAIEIGLCLSNPPCGAGTCEAGDFPTAQFGYRCACGPGYANIGNFSAAPCIQDCAVTAACKDLNVPVGAPPPAGNIITHQPPSPSSALGAGSKRNSGYTHAIRLSSSLSLAIASLAFLI